MGLRLKGDFASFAAAASGRGTDRRHVVHLVGSYTTSVHRFLAPATEVLLDAGFVQSVLLVEDPAARGLAASLHPTIKIVMLSGQQSTFGQWRLWIGAARALLAETPPDVVHLHGFIPAALSLNFLSGSSRTHIVYSPHDSRLHQSRTVSQRMLGRLARPLLGEVARSAVISMPTEARVLHRLPGVEVSKVDTPVDLAYFGTERHPARHPLVVGGVVDATPDMAGRFAQAAVLMGNGEHGLAFNWIGAANGDGRDKLNAANVGIVDAMDATTRASRLGAAWIYLCAHSVRGFPGHIAEAMAIGLPVVALDSEAHRDLVADGESGFLYENNVELVSRIHLLIEDSALRARFSDRAKDIAYQRFGGGDFGASIVRAYSG